MKKLVTAIVVYPVEVKLEITKNTNPDEIFEMLLTEADKLKFNPNISPIIYSCSEPNVLPKIQKLEKTLDSQSDWLNSALTAIQTADKSLKIALKSIPFIQRLRYGDKLEQLLRTGEKNITQLHREIVRAVSPPDEQ